MKPASFPWTLFIFLFLAAPSLRAAPATGPTGVAAISRYGSAPAINVQWNRVAGVTMYEVWRSVNGGASALAISATWPGAGALLGWTDTGVNTTDQYEYLVKACDAMGCTDGGKFKTSVRVLWPISGGHEVLHGFNEVLGYAGIRGGDPNAATRKVGFHDGVDLNRTTVGATAGDNVSAPRGGVVNQVITTGNVDDGFIAILVDLGVDGMGNAVVEYDSFNHIATTAGNLPSVAVGDIVAPGQQIAKIGTTHFSTDFADHVHSMVTVGSAFASSARHFLTIFTANADRDPLGNNASLFDENNDGKMVLFRDHAEADLTKYLDYDHTMPFPLRLKPLSGDIDIHTEVTDQQGSNPRQAPIQLAYWIEGPQLPADDIDDVKSSAKPYKLYDFTTNYFGAGTPTNCTWVADIHDPANSGCKGQTVCNVNPGVACNSVIKEGAADFPWPILHHFIITHAKGEDGSRANVDILQHWNTNAKDDEAVATVAHANYAGKPDTTKPYEARFPDGEYTIHLLASDLVNANVALKIENVRIENFAPFIKELSVYQDLDGNAGTQVDADHPGCEFELYKYKHEGNPKPYPGAAYLILSQREAFARADRQICVRVRFSEGMDPAFLTVELDPQGAAGTAPLAFAGAFSKTYTENDTWKGTLTVPLDPTGNSDSSILLPNRDAVVRVKARDLKDRMDNQRGLDENGDGTPEADSFDENHRIRLDASAPKTTIEVKKT